ncbi:hypothetical protein DPMN_008261 [Dreissena polymorpha]|uniref:Uncharacterized protein n=1 Tax=Dreissena polymorpha TaxID=45954 RepID=A0A9D4RZG9_DREPO|nr:hypothetical protein DPMN_008261 [Dreissena polymorpha]
MPCSLPDASFFTFITFTDTKAVGTLVPWGRVVGQAGYILPPVYRSPLLVSPLLSRDCKPV